MIRVDGRSDSSSLISVRGLNKTYRRGGEQIQVLQGLNLDVDKGDFVAFMGPSGSGKTTLLNLLGGLDVPQLGTVSVAGDEITHMSSGKLTEWRARHVGFVFQMYNLVPVLTAFQNVELAALADQALPIRDRRKHVETALAIVGLRGALQIISRANFPAGRSSAWPSPAPSFPIPRFSFATSPPATWTARAPTKSWS